MSANLEQLVADAQAQVAPASSPGTEFWQRVMPWEDLQAKSPPGHYAELGKDILAVLATLTAMGPDRPRLLRTDALSRLLTATSMNPSLLLIAPAGVNGQVLQTNGQYIAPPGTVLLLLNQSGQSEIVTVLNWTGGTQLNVDRPLQFAYAIGDSATVIPDVELRSVPRFVGSMTVSPVSTQSMTVQLPAGTKCVYVTGRTGTHVGIPGTVTVSGVQTGTTYYSGTGMPGPQNPLLIDSIDDNQLTISAQNSGSSQGGMAVFCYASLSNDVVLVGQAPGSSLAITPATAALFGVTQRPEHPVLSGTINAAFPANTNTSVVAGVSGKTIRLLSITGAVDTAAAGTLLTFQDGAGGAQIGGHHCGTTTPAYQDFGAALGGRALTAGNGLFANPGGSAVVFRGTITYSQD